VKFRQTTLHSAISASCTKRRYRHYGLGGCCQWICACERVLFEHLGTFVERCIVLRLNPYRHCLPCDVTFVNDLLHMCWIFSVVYNIYLSIHIYYVCFDIQLNFVKTNFIKTNNSLRRSKISVPNRVLLILTKIQLVKSKYLCRTFYVSKHIIFAVPKWSFLHKINWLSRTAVSQFSHLSTRTMVVMLWDDCVTIECSFTPSLRSPRVICNC